MNTLGNTAANGYDAHAELTRTSDVLTWQDQVDAIDPFFGDPARLAELVQTAPSPAARAWLEEQARENEKFRQTLFCQ